MRLTQICRFPERLLSTVQRGTAFEYRALALLTKHMSMSLTRVGGSNDGGIDLIGWWWVPSNKNLTTTHPLDATVAPMGCTVANRRRLRVLAQCKAEKRKMGPAYLRELEGVAYKYNEGDSNSSTPTIPKEPPPIALLVSQSAFTQKCLLAAHASPLPFLLVHLPPRPPALPLPISSSDSGGGGDGDAIGAIFGNPALVSPKGVLGGELEIRWERGGGSGVPSSSQSSGMLDDSGRPRLWWQGQPLPSWTPGADAVADVGGT